MYLQAVVLKNPWNQHFAIAANMETVEESDQDQQQAALIEEGT